MTNLETQSTNESVLMGKAINRSDDSEVFIAKAKSVSKSLAIASSSVLFTIGASHTSSINGSVSIDHPKTSNTTTSTYKAENRLNEKLQKALQHVCHVVFEYNARISSINTKKGLAIIEADIGNGVEFLEWPLEKIPFQVDSFSTFKLQGCRIVGKERFRFIPNNSSPIDDETREMIALLDYV